MSSAFERRYKMEVIQDSLDDLMELDGPQIAAVIKASALSKLVTDVTLGPKSKYNSRDVYNCSDGIYDLSDTVSHSQMKNPFLMKSYVSSNGVDNGRNSNVNNLRTEIADNTSRSTMKLMYELDQQRRMEVNDAVKERLLKMNKDYQIRKLEMQSKQQCLQREIEARVLHEEQLILCRLQEEEILASQRQQQLAQEHRQHAQRVNEWSERIKEAEKMRKEAEEEERQRMKERKLQLDQIYQYQLEFRKKYEQIAELARQCKDRQGFIKKCSSHTAKLKNLNEAMDQLVKQCKVGEISSLDLQTASTVVQQVDVLYNIIKEETDKINEQLLKSLNESSQPKTEKASSGQTSESSQATGTVQSLVKSAEGLVDFVDKEAYNIYLSLQQHLKTYETSYQNLAKDERYKKFKFECQKAVNIPVNAISPTSADHLQDKLFKLSRLISGQPVQVGHGQIVASSHPDGIPFCKYLLAQRFVMQGEQTVSSKSEAAFAIAAVIEALWADYPDFGQLILAYFHKECPYLIPMFMPQVEGQSNVDYYKSLGYHYNADGEVEKQDKFLKRMSGIMRLYAAILVTRPCRYQKNKNNPHGLSEAWRWIACLLNTDPRPDICATLLYAFLEVAGNAMYTHYGRQFQKLLHLICKEYFPRIEKVTPSVSSGPMIRLKVFLEKILKLGHIPPPTGLLPPNFW